MANLELNKKVLVLVALCRETRSLDRQELDQILGELGDRNPFPDGIGQGVLDEPWAPASPPAKV